MIDYLSNPKLYNDKTHELQDDKILMLMEKAMDDYKVGAIIEARDTLLDIVRAIDRFSKDN